MSTTKLLETSNAKLELTGPFISRPDQLKLAGKTPQIALLVAACDNKNSFADIRSTPIYNMQLRGFGKSLVEDRQVESLDLGDYVSDFQVALREIKAKQPVMLGYSHSGYFATRYAIKNAESLAGLILVEPALFTDRDDLLRRAELAEKGDSAGAIQKMLDYVDNNGAEANSKIEGEILKNSQAGETLAAEFRIRANNPISPEELRNLTMPVLLIGGTKSKLAEVVSNAAELIPRAYVWWIPGASHLDLISTRFKKQMTSVVQSFLLSL